MTIVWVVLKAGRGGARCPEAPVLRIAARTLHASGFVERGGGLSVVCCLFCGSVEVKVHKRPRSVWLVVSRPRVTGPLEQGVPT